MTGSRLSLVELLIFVRRLFRLLGKELRNEKTYVCRESGVYNHSGDDGKEDPPVPIPNTEVKLFYAESTYG